MPVTEEALFRSVASQEPPMTDKAIASAQIARLTEEFLAEGGVIRRIETIHKTAEQISKEAIKTGWSLNETQYQRHAKRNKRAMPGVT